MPQQFLDKKTHSFYFINAENERTRYKLIFGDEVQTLPGPALSGLAYSKVIYRDRVGEWREPDLSTERSLELYFLDVGQGDAAFIVTPNNTKILVDGGLRDRALGFLIWKYRLDLSGNQVTLDHLFLNHADRDHVEGLIPLLNHPNIMVNSIHHNGIGLFDSGFNTDIGNLSTDDRLTTLHDGVGDLAGLNLASGTQQVFDEWIQTIETKNIPYGRLDRSDSPFNIGDDKVTCEIIGPVLEPGGQSLRWFGDKSHTINGHSLVFRLSYGNVRVFFSGDLNEDGGEHLLNVPNGALSLNAHVFKAPHHGSHDFSKVLFEAVNPMNTIVSSGEVPDHGHPRANFLGVIGRASRGVEPLLFSTELAALFVDSGDPASVQDNGTETTLGDLDFTKSEDNAEARQRFKKVLPGIINVRTNGEEIYAFRRVQQSYQ
jgi:beta-lactamase superfamily II metal-dependent hydrolase